MYFLKVGFYFICEMTAVNRLILVIMNFIIVIYSRSDTVCSFVGPFLTTSSLESAILAIMNFTYLNQFG